MINRRPFKLLGVTLTVFAVAVTFPIVAALTVAGILLIQRDSGTQQPRPVASRSIPTQPAVRVITATTQPTPTTTVKRVTPTPSTTSDEHDASFLVVSGSSANISASEALDMTHSSGARIEIPIGAITEPVTVTISEIESPDDQVEVGRVFDFSIGDAELAQPVTLHIPFDLQPGIDAQDIIALHWNDEIGFWELLDGVVDESSGTIAVTVSELSPFTTRRPVDHCSDLYSRVKSASGWGDAWKAPDNQEVIRITNTVDWDRIDLRKHWRDYENSERCLLKVLYLRSLSYRRLGQLETSWENYLTMIPDDVSPAYTTWTSERRVIDLDTAPSNVVQRLALIELGQLLPMGIDVYNYLTRIGFLKDWVEDESGDLQDLHPVYWGNHKAWSPKAMWGIERHNEVTHSIPDAGGLEVVPQPIEDEVNNHIERLNLQEVTYIRAVRTVMPPGFRGYYEVLPDQVELMWRMVEFLVHWQVALVKTGAEIFTNLFYGFASSLATFGGRLIGDLPSESGESVLGDLTLTARGCNGEEEFFRPALEMFVHENLAKGFLLALADHVVKEMADDLREANIGTPYDTACFETGQPAYARISDKREMPAFAYIVYLYGVDADGKRVDATWGIYLEETEPNNASFQLNSEVPRANRPTTDLGGRAWRTYFSAESIVELLEEPEPPAVTSDPITTPAGCANKAVIRDITTVLPTPRDGRESAAHQIEVQQIDSSGPDNITLVVEVKGPDGFTVYDSNLAGENQTIDISSGRTVLSSVFDWDTGQQAEEGQYSVLVSIRNADNWDDVCHATWRGAWGAGIGEVVFDLAASDAAQADPGTLLWVYEDEFRSASILAVYDGVAYIATSGRVGSSYYESAVYALDATTGDLIWRRNMEGLQDAHIKLTPDTVVSDGIVYVGARNVLYALDATTGDLIWESDRNKDGTIGFGTNSLLVSDGVVYFGAGGVLYAVDATTGSLVWESDDKVGSVSTNLVVSDEVVYYGGRDDILYAVDATTGGLVWRYDTGGARPNSPVVSDGVVYFGADDGVLYALDTTTGDLVWRYETESGHTRDPVVSDGVVYFGADDGELYADGVLYALDAKNGDLVWRYYTGDLVHDPVVSDGVLYFGSSRRAYLYALDVATGDLLWRYYTGVGRSQAVRNPVVIDGVVYFSTALRDGNIYAVVAGYGINGVTFDLSNYATTETEPGTLLWQYDTGAEFIVPGLVVHDSVVYFGKSDIYNGGLYAVDITTNNLLWHYDTGRSLIDGLVVSNGVAYFIARHRTSNTLYAVDVTTKDLVWEYYVRHGIVDPVVFDGMVYFGADDGVLYAVDATTGSLVWQYNSRGDYTRNPVVSDGMVYFGADDGVLYAVDATTGSLVWRYDTGSDSAYDPVVSDGVVYFGADDGVLYAVDATTGSLVWQYDTGGTVVSSPTVSDGVVYFGAGGVLHAVDATTGSLVWGYDAGGYSYSAYDPVVSDGVVYFSRDNSIFALNATTGYLLWSYYMLWDDYSRSSSSAPVVFGNTVYSVGDDGVIYAVATGIPSFTYTEQVITPVCNRMPKIVDAILNALPFSQCQDVTATHLASLTELDISSTYSRITGWRRSDFSGLSSLQSLYLHENRLSSLPEDVFSGLSSLQTLDLSINDLSSLPPDIFSGLSSLQTLDLSINDLSSLPPDIFSGLSSLQSLYLQYNDLSSLPEDVFSGLSSLQTLDLSINDLSSLPPDIFSGLSSLQSLYLHENRLSSLPEDVFSGLSSLQTLDLSINDLSPLPDVFSGLSSLQELYLYGNQLSSLPEDVFSGLSGLQTLDLSRNDLSSLPPDIFSSLSSLRVLLVYRNELGNLPASYFQGIGLDKLEELWLGEEDAVGGDAREDDEWLAHYQAVLPCLTRLELERQLSPFIRGEPTDTCVSTNSDEYTPTPTPVPTTTYTPVPTATYTPVPTATHTPAPVVPTATYTPVPIIPTATYTPVPMTTYTPVPTATYTPIPTATHTPTPIIPIATYTPVPTATDTPTPVPTATYTPIPTATDIPVPTATYTPTPIATVKPSPPSLEMLWSYDTGTTIDSSPAVSEGVAYIGSNNDSVYALDVSSGSVAWSYETGSAVGSSPKVSDGVVYIGSNDGHIHALDIDTGQLAWRYRTGSEWVYSSPAVSDDGVVYVGSNNGYLYALEAATVRLIWQRQTGDDIRSSPTVSAGIVYVGSNDNYLYALDAATGDVKWRYKSGDDIRSSPTVSDGVVYFGSWDGKVYALDAVTGRALWSYRTGDDVESSPVVSDGVVYVGSWDKHVYALDASSGELLWRYETGGGVVSSPAIADGVVYVGSIDGYLYALDAKTGELLQRFQTGDDIRSSPTVSDGVVYFGSWDHHLYALDTAPVP